MVRDAQNSYLTADAADEENEETMNRLLGSSITYRIAMGPHQGRKVFTFLLHAGVATRANLTRYNHVHNFAVRPIK